MDQRQKVFEKISKQANNQELMTTIYKKRKIPLSFFLINIEQELKQAEKYDKENNEEMIEECLLKIAGSIVHCLSPLLNL